MHMCINNTHREGFFCLTSKVQIWNLVTWMASTNNNEQSTISARRIAKDLNTYAKMGSEYDIMKHWISYMAIDGLQHKMKYGIMISECKY